MATATFHNAGPRDDMNLPMDYLEPRWYAAYTSANHEKRVATELHARAVEHFLPVYSSVRRWKDRRVQLELPLFPGYVFVRLALPDRLRVLQTPSVVRLVGFNGAPTALPDLEIETLRERLNRRFTAEPYPLLTVGRRVQVKSGPLQGFQGIMVRKKGRLRFVVTIELLMRSIIADVDLADLDLSVPL